MKAEWEDWAMGSVLHLMALDARVGGHHRDYYWVVDSGSIKRADGWEKTMNSAKAAAEAALDAMIAELAAARGYKLVKEGDA